MRNLVYRFFHRLLPCRQKESPSKWTNMTQELKVLKKFSKPFFQQLFSINSIAMKNIFLEQRKVASFDLSSHKIILRNRFYPFSAMIAIARLF